MKLSTEQIKGITAGAVRIEENEGKISFYRFTKEEEEFYLDRSPADFYKKTFATAGVKLCFKTNSKALGLKVGVKQASSRKYFAFDICVNGELYDSINNYDNVDYPDSYAAFGDFEQREDFEKSIDLPNGENEITIYFPWSYAGSLISLTLDDGATLAPVKREKTLLMYGDSITHGYDALHPINTYSTRLADKLGYAQYNKAIGGEIYVPGLARIKQDFTPDLISVAYGSNDWSKCSKDTFERNCAEFFEALVQNYPYTEIYVITPIWRKDENEAREFGKFSSVALHIEECVKKYPQITLVNGYNFVPHEEKYFADLRLHPNDAGFEHCTENLLKALKESKK
ncbi:MAG: SGNH/GDSL hydrolase family protein [Clostridia bacterium]|nr:SGNH/GDSL hydrolase family protein [Clostridia bacterium]